jgi:hypothetical protein
MPAMTRPSTACLIGLLLAFTAAGGCSFDRKWRDMKRAAISPDASDAQADAPSDALAGRWEGSWASNVNGHSGRLRAIITPVAGEADPKYYRVDFDAYFMGILRFGHGMTVVATPNSKPGTIAFTGEEDLGKMAGGVYRYAGTADGRTFTSSYESSNDRGRFEMTRPRE